jgi:pimeloyl-ACP methyl ester carboxylesterase
MPRTDIQGVSINYEILGERGPSMMLSPGGRNGYAAIKPFAQNMADKGYRVLLHDRRNTGSSDIAFDRGKSEFEVWADDLEVLLRQLGMAPAVIGGSSSGARLAFTLALRYPKSVRALILWRVTGGGFAVKRLAERYYDQYIRLAREGGMAAVCAEDHFAELIRNRPSNRDRLMAMDVDAFVACMQAWRAPFVAGAELPVVGASDAELRSIKVPTMIIPGNDLTHNSGTGQAAAICIPDCEIHRLPMPDQNVDMVPTDEWYAQAGDIASVFAEFLARKLPHKAATPAA